MLIMLKKINPQARVIALHGVLINALSCMLSLMHTLPDYNSILN